MNYIGCFSLWLWGSVLDVALIAHLPQQKLHIRLYFDRNVLLPKRGRVYPVGKRGTAKSPQLPPFTSIKSPY